MQTGCARNNLPMKQYPLAIIIFGQPQAPGLGWLTVALQRLCMPLLREHSGLLNAFCVSDHCTLCLGVMK